MGSMKQRILPLIACLISVALCLCYAKFRKELPPWWKANGGGVPYVMFWILLWYTAIPNPRHILKIVVGCVLFTCFLEFAQLWNPEPLASFRKTRLGAAWLGAAFHWEDIPPYFLGGVAGYLCLLGLSVVRTNSETSAKASSE